MNPKNSFTIHTELIDGTLSGARNIYMGANSTCHLYVIPREEIALANNVTDIAGQPAFYMLIGESESGNSQAYIGQTTDFANRKNDHLQKKDFWTKALVFVSDNHKIYGDDVKYLEYLGIMAAQEVSSYYLLNGANPKKPTIAPYRVNDMEGFFRDIQFLTRFYGCNIFDVQQEVKPQSKLFYVHSEERPAHGVGYYDSEDEKFVLLKDSRLAGVVVPSYTSKDARNVFIKENCKSDNGQFILMHDVSLNTPSAASGLVLGRPSNGWSDWKDEEGNKLGDFIRRNK